MAEGLLCRYADVAHNASHNLLQMANVMLYPLCWKVGVDGMWCGVAGRRQPVERGSLSNRCPRVRHASEVTGQTAAGVAMPEDAAPGTQLLTCPMTEPTKCVVLQLAYAFAMMRAAMWL